MKVNWSGVLVIFFLRRGTPDPTRTASWVKRFCNQADLHVTAGFLDLLLFPFNVLVGFPVRLPRAARALFSVPLQFTLSFSNTATGSVFFCFSASDFFRVCYATSCIDWQLLSLVVCRSLLKA